MKTLFTFTLVFFYSLIFSQETQLVNYSEVVKTDSLRKADDLYSQTKMWFVDAFKNSKYVIQLDDNVNKTIIGEGEIPYSSGIFIGSATTIGVIKFKISISAKDGRYKYDIGNFNHVGRTFSFGYITTAEDPEIKFGFTSTRIKVYKEIKDKISLNIEPLIISLKEYMKENKVSTKQDW